MIGAFAFAFVLQGAVLELSFARGRGDPARESAIARTALASVLLLSCGAAVLGGALALVPGLGRQAAWGAVAFAALLPLVGVSSWCHRVLLAAQRFDLLGRLVLLQMAGIATSSLAGAAAFGLAVAIGGVGVGYLGATAYGVQLCRRTGALGLALDGELMRELAAVGLPQTGMLLVMMSSRVLDRNFAYVGYGDALGGVFAIAAMFALNLVLLTQVLAEAARPAINEECAAHGAAATGSALGRLPEAILALAIGVTGTAWFAAPFLYELLFARYLEVLAEAPALAVAALAAECPTMLAFAAHMYLVATKRPLVYYVPSCAALAVMLSGNLVGLALHLGLFWIVAVKGFANAVMAVAAVLLVARRYPAMQGRCTGQGRAAVALLAAALALAALLDPVGAWAAAGLGLTPAWGRAPGAVAFVVWTGVVVVRWSRSQSRPAARVAAGAGS
ncbi:MAG TPA: hypothetical protein VMT87_05510 [Vicinamibacteria bacterium]|nr:hypothetical protein [Vicinamibacteria bacterium]